MAALMTYSGSLCQRELFSDILHDIDPMFDAWIAERSDETDGSLCRHNFNLIHRETGEKLYFHEIHIDTAPDCSQSRVKAILNAQLYLRQPPPLPTLNDFLTLL